jgi:hypothetical protein
VTIRVQATARQHPPISMREAVWMATERSVSERAKKCTVGSRVQHLANARTSRPCIACVSLVHVPVLNSRRLSTVIARTAHSHAHITPRDMHSAFHLLRPHYTADTYWSCSAFDTRHILTHFRAFSQQLATVVIHFHYGGCMYVCMFVCVYVG